MFDLVSDYAPAGDQPQAVAKLTEGILSGTKHQVLLGVSGSGKRYTIANVIKNVNKTTLVISQDYCLLVCAARRSQTSPRCDPRGDGQLAFNPSCDLHARIPSKKSRFHESAQPGRVLSAERLAGDSRASAHAFIR